MNQPSENMLYISFLAAAMMILGRMSTHVSWVCLVISFFLFGLCLSHFPSVLLMETLVLLSFPLILPVSLFFLMTVDVAK